MNEIELYLEKSLHLVEAVILSCRHILYGLSNDGEVLVNVCDIKTVFKRIDMEDLLSFFFTVSEAEAEVCKALILLG